MTQARLFYGTLTYGALTVCALVFNSACVVRTNARPPRARVTVQANTPPPPQPNATVVVQAQTPQAASGVTVVEATCQQGAQEVCNGLDDNCDGIIDEGCGYQSGNIQITLGWNTGADLDMYVTDPTGFEIYYGASQSPSGGRLDHDARGACDRSTFQPGGYSTENVYWDQQNPPNGSYGVDVNYWNGDCSTRNGMT
ncbi:MAG: MopE-related protein, partial [Myxococcota bacterium]